MDKILGWKKQEPREKNLTSLSGRDGNKWETTDVRPRSQIELGNGGCGFVKMSKNTR